MFFPPGAYFANPMALQMGGMGGMLNPSMTLQQQVRPGWPTLDWHDSMGWGSCLALLWVRSRPLQAAVSRVSMP